MEREVAITGIGWIGASGAGRESLAARFRDGVPVSSPVPPEPTAHRPGGARRASVVTALDTSPWISPMAARRMGRPARFAVAAARLALEDAGLPGISERPDRAAVVLATAFGPVRFTERLVRQIVFEDPLEAQPALFSECVANAAAAQVAIAIGARGANVTITQAEAGPVLALGRAAREVASGRADLALAGAVEEITPLLHAILDRFGALARPEPDGSERARPFDRARRGFLAAEGATVLVLEPLDAARDRGAIPVARVRQAGSAFDPSAPAGGWGRGAGSLADTLARSLARAEVDLGSIGRVVSGASGSVAGDLLEGRWLKSAWGNRPLPPILAPKGASGEYGGAILAAGALAVTDATFGATAAFEEPDPEMSIVPHDGSPLPPAHRALLTSAGSGGAAGWAVLERP